MAGFVLSKRISMTHFRDAAFVEKIPICRMEEHSRNVNICEDVVALAFVELGKLSGLEAKDRLYF